MFLGSQLGNLRVFVMFHWSTEEEPFSVNEPKKHDICRYNKTTHVVCQAFFADFCGNKKKISENGQ